MNVSLLVIDRYEVSQVRKMKRVSCGWKVVWMR